MKYRQLGRSGLQVSEIGLGTNNFGIHPGPTNYGSQMTPQAARDVIDAALDFGVNLIDTADVYSGGDSERYIGRALRGKRHKAVIATKFGGWWLSDKAGVGGSRQHIVTAVDRSLSRLRTDYIDLYQIHGLQLEDVDSVMNDLLPELERQRQAGRIRFIGVTELWGHDGSHQALLECLPSGQFDTAMIGYNLLNSCAEDRLFEICRTENVGVIIMFAIRRAMSDLARRRQTFDHLVEEGYLEGASLDNHDPLAWLVSKEVRSVMEAGYRFAIEPDVVGTVLTGTSKEQHLKQNLSAIAAGPLPKTLRSKIKSRYELSKDNAEESTIGAK